MVVMGWSLNFSFLCGVGGLTVIHVYVRMVFVVMLQFFVFM
jgi:hypothetical protein